MPLVRLRSAIAGRNFSYPDGAEVDVPGETASAWLAAGIAVLVTEDRASTPERGAVSEVRRRVGRPRKNP
jgi:hypothetical protein